GKLFFQHPLSQRGQSVVANFAAAEQDVRVVLVVREAVCAVVEITGVDANRFEKSRRQSVIRVVQHGLIQGDVSRHRVGAQ
ncbi:MAG TPA: hypothetical protein QF901_12045, partial [Gammaproteobacteria bacterium]|nr:hypothetical protein [Gammaproteobacteria bacterium]